MNSNIAEHRMFERLNCNFNVQLYRRAPYSLERTTLRDISAGGAAVETKKSLPLNEEVELRIFPKKGSSPLTRQGKITWSRQEVSGRWRVGVEFDNLSLLESSQFLKYLQ